MKLEVNITKKYFFILLGAILLIAGFIGVIAYAKSPGAIPNPGHALNTIQGYFSGDANLDSSLGKFCQADGTNCFPLDSDHCVFTDTGASSGDGAQGYFKLNLTKATPYTCGAFSCSTQRVICNDANGCTINEWSYSNSNYAGIGYASVKMRQVATSSGFNWLAASFDPKKGRNGDSTKEPILTSSNGGLGSVEVSDDVSSNSETSWDSISIEDLSSSTSFIISVCDY